MLSDPRMRRFLLSQATLPATSILLLLISLLLSYFDLLNKFTAISALILCCLVGYFLDVAISSKYKSSIKN